MHASAEAESRGDEPRLAATLETTPETWMIRAAVAGGCLQGLGSVAIAILNLSVKAPMLHRVRDVAAVVLTLGLTWGVQKRSFACATLLLISSLATRAWLLPHRHGTRLVETIAGLVLSTILYALGVWATHAIDVRANARWRSDSRAAMNSRA